MKQKILAFILTLSCGALYAQAIKVTDAWVRATVKGQQATGAFMTLTAKDGARLVGVVSSVAGVTQVHQMKMEGGVMKMNEVKGGLDLPAGQGVEFKPGAYHVMLMDLKAPLTQGSQVPLTLLFKDAKGVPGKLELKVPVAAIAPTGMAHGNMPANKVP